VNLESAIFRNIYIVVMRCKIGDESIWLKSIVFDMEDDSSSRRYIMIGTFDRETKSKVRFAAEVTPIG